MSLLLKKGTQARSVFQLPASKSVSNRLLIMQALANHSFEIHNLSAATDTLVLQEALQQKGLLVDVKDCGTAMRFLTAYFALKQRAAVLHGTPRMNQRPVGGLVELLLQLGADIEYLDEPGFPPLHIQGYSSLESLPVRPAKQLSSQFISAILLIGPYLPHGLRIQLPDHQPSSPYIQLTLHWMQQLGVVIQPDKQWINIRKGQYAATAPVKVDADWSAAAFAYAWFWLGEATVMEIPDLRLNSAQGDEILKEWFQEWGITTTATPEGIQLYKTARIKPEKLELDMKDYPDLAPALVVLAAIAEVPGIFNGLENLSLKESDRTAALSKELNKTGVRFVSQGNGRWKLEGKAVLKPGTQFKVYEDHRLAMAFALFASIADIQMEDNTVVQKSFPAYWGQLY